MLLPIMSSNPVSILALPRYALLMQAFLPPVESLPNPGEPPLPGLTFLTVPDARNGHTNSVKLFPFFPTPNNHF
ncbi:hypothetical protein [Brucella vulpis]|uniref:hypothetical protein n=1 Tax=Brucella vulpis TaxID=981386 RepID=UPI0009E4793F